MMFSSIHFNLRISIQFKFLKMHSIQLALCKFIQYNFHSMELNFHKINSFLFQLIIIGNAKPKFYFTCRGPKANGKGYYNYMI